MEDDYDIATLLRLNLQDEGYQIVHEADGAKSLALLEKQVWDAVLLDLMLPNVDGLEICRRIRQMAGYLPVIIISARTSEIHRILGLEMGADDYLPKPFSVQELIARVKALFRRRSHGAKYPSGRRPDPLSRFAYRPTGARSSFVWRVDRSHSPASLTCCTGSPVTRVKSFPVFRYWTTSGVPT